jgi:hypothetical protein
MKSTILVFAILATVAAPLAAQESSPVRDRAVLPVVGSTAGAFGSNFKTELQMNNRSLQPMRGAIVYRPQGTAPSANDPIVPFVLAPFETIAFSDIVASMGASGLGSLDFLVYEGGIPTLIARAYDDRGNDGTVGAVVTPVRQRDAMKAGDSASLLTPADLARFRFNVGVRTLADGATLRITLRGSNGIVRETFDRSYQGEFFIQQAVEAFIGSPVLSNESIQVEVLAGSAIVYGTTTDNTTNDPSLQLATVWVVDEP